MSKSIYKPRPISGFPEWLPEVRMVEQQWFDHIRRVFESYGFCSIETPSVEELDVLAAKGEVDKEIYVIERLHKEEDDKEARLGLHFDQTVPLARYVAQHFNDLTFPFKRYQIQKVWRGERAQAGRFREFYQCDIDVINVDNLPIHFDAEMPAIMWEILSQIPGMEDERFQIQISNRKILTGLLEILHVSSEDDRTIIFRIIDKKDKLHNFYDELKKELAKVKNINPKYSLYNSIHDFLDWADRIKSLNEVSTIKNQIKIINDYLVNPEYMENSTYKAGVEELIAVLNGLAHLPPGDIIADLSIVRGLDYYTGTVYETRFVDDPGYGSICSGGRYDDLAGSYINKHLPGVGISIGFSRLFERIRAQKKLPVSRKSPTDVLVTVLEDAQRAKALQLAAQLRKRNMNVEVYHTAQKIQKQLGYADKKQIPYVWFLPGEGKTAHQVKDMQSGAQTDVDPNTWVTA